MPSSFKVLSASLLILIFCSISTAIACCSLAPAHFANTYGWVAETQKDGKLVHLLLYQNTARNLVETPHSDDDTLTEPAGNAMMLPIPAVPGSMTSDNMLEGKNYKKVGETLSNVTPRFFEDLRQMIFDFNGYSQEMFAGSMSKSAVQAEAQVFDRGSYTVVLANNASKVADALCQVPLKRRPKLPREIIEAYGKWYPGWTFALCCFAKEAGGEPIVWWYEPKDPSHLFFPALDAHTGKAPVLNTLVDVDHHLTVSSKNMFTLLTDTPFSAVREVQGTLPSDLNLVPKHVMGHNYSGQLPQGDFVFSTAETRVGVFRPLRQLPPGAGESSLVSLANFLTADPMIIIKMACGFPFAAMVILILRRFRLGLIFVAAWPLLMWLEDITSAPKSIDGHILFAFLRTVIVTAAVLLPVVLANGKKNQRLCAILAIALLLVLYLLPGYASAWAPAGWFFLAVMAATKPNSDTEAKPTEAPAQ